jgi:hypothetical protein
MISPTPNIHHDSEPTIRACGEAGKNTECMAQGGGAAGGEFFGLAFGVCAGAGTTIM